MNLSQESVSGSVKDQRPCYLRGLVLDAEGNPVPYSLLTLHRDGGAVFGQIQSDEHGTFVLLDLDAARLYDADAGPDRRVGILEWRCESGPILVNNFEPWATWQQRLKNTLTKIRDEP